MATKSKAPPSTATTQETEKSKPVIWIIWATAVVVSALILALDLPREIIGGLTLVLVVALLLGGVPIGLSMITASVIGLAGMQGFGGVTRTFQELIFNSTATWSLSVIPLFILMGIALWKSGITTKAFEAALQWVGNLPGGLAVATNFSGAGLAAASGSSIGISYALGRIAIPEMLKAGYKPSLATGSVAMAGTLGQLIPPSILLVVYAGVAQTAVGPQLLAAIIPGIIMALAYGVLIIVRCAISPELAPKTDIPGVTWGTRFKSLLGMMPLTIIVLIVIGGMFIGFFTPTEAGAVGALAAIFVGWFAVKRGDRSLRAFFVFMRETLTETVISAAGIFMMLIGVGVLTRMLTVSRLTSTFTEWLVSINLNYFTFLFLLALLYLFLGMFLDPLAMILLTVPILYEPLGAIGVDMIWFGIFLVILCEIGQVSPPVGILNFVVHRIAQEPTVNLGQEIKLTEVFKGVIWFVVVTLMVLIVIVIFPEIALWLPGSSQA